MSAEQYDWPSWDQWERMDRRARIARGKVLLRQALDRTAYTDRLSEAETQAIKMLTTDLEYRYVAPDEDVTA